MTRRSVTSEIEETTTTTTTTTPTTTPTHQHTNHEKRRKRRSAASSSPTTNQSDDELPDEDNRILYHSFVESDTSSGNHNNLDDDNNNNNNNNNLDEDYDNDHDKKKQKYTTMWGTISQYMNSTRLMVLLVLCLQNSLFTVLRRYSQGVLQELYSTVCAGIVGIFFVITNSNSMVFTQISIFPLMLRSMNFYWLLKLLKLYILLG
jgi:hypothetical protein